MPLTGNRAQTGANQPDMPAVWMLNAQLVNTFQYGCNCWTSGCGELDLFEALNSGQTKLKATLHVEKGIGSENWFPRPTQRTIKASVAFDPDSNAVHIKILPDDTVFSASLSATTVLGLYDTSNNGTFANVSQVINA